MTKAMFPSPFGNPSADYLPGAGGRPLVLLFSVFFPAPAPPRRGPHPRRGSPSRLECEIESTIRPEGSGSGSQPRAPPGGSEFAFSRSNASL